MSNLNPLFTSWDEWETPQDLYDSLDAEFHFTLDPCATNKNHKCKMFYTKDDDGLSQDRANETVFCNPPYSQFDAWSEKASRESLKDNTLVVLLHPSRRDAKDFHDFSFPRTEFRFVKFGDSKDPGPFSAMIVILRGGIYMNDTERAFNKKKERKEKNNENDR